MDRLAPDLPASPEQSLNHWPATLSLTFWEWINSRSLTTWAGEWVTQFTLEIKIMLINNN